MASTSLPRVVGIDARRLVYFHNHGDPGPGLYLPETWQLNRAKWSERGSTVQSDFDPKVLHALPAEGFYRVTKAFHCCSKQCTKFEADMFVQLGYNGEATPLVFVPLLGSSGISIPDRGAIVDENMLRNLQPLRVVPGPGGDDGGKPELDISMPRAFIVH